MSNDLKKLEQLKTLIQLSSLINSTLDTMEIRKYAIEAAMKLLNAEAASLLLVDQETGDLFFQVALGEKGEKLKEVRLKKGEGIAGWVAEKGEAVIIHDVKSDQRFFKTADERSSFSTRNMVCVPIKTKDKILGVLEALNKKHDNFNQEDKETLSALANQVAMAIENANLYQELKEAFYGTAEALAETIEQRDPYTGGHTKRVMNYCLAIGESLGFSKKEMENLRLAAILHDVGKIGVRDSILLKEGKLNHDELVKMNMHAEYGAKTLSHVKPLKDIVLGVRGHHERVDGKGYPDNLKDGEIHILARIIAVADTFDAMTTDRPYRKALSVEIALEELRRNIGTQFDGDVVDAFIRFYKEERFES